jgi:hypothetical protein
MIGDEGRGDTRGRVFQGKSLGGQDAVELSSDDIMVAVDGIHRGKGR